MSKSIFALLTIGKKEHLEKFRGGGLLFMRSPADLRDLERDAFRADSFEGWDTIIQPRDVGVTITNPLVSTFTASPSDLAGPVLIGMAMTASCNIYCMFAITGPVDGGFDSRLLEVPDADSLVAVLTRPSLSGGCPSQRRCKSWQANTA